MFSTTTNYNYLKSTKIGELASNGAAVAAVTPLVVALKHADYD